MIIYHFYLLLFAQFLCYWVKIKEIVVFSLPLSRPLYLVLSAQSEQKLTEKEFLGEVSLWALLLSPLLWGRTSLGEHDRDVNNIAPSVENYFFSQFIWRMDHFDEQMISGCQSDNLSKFILHITDLNLLNTRLCQAVRKHLVCKFFWCIQLQY